MESYNWIIQIHIDNETMLDKNITMDDIHYTLNTYNDEISCSYTDLNSNNLIFRIRLNISNRKRLTAT